MSTHHRTRKNKNVLTIPQLRRSFHAVESYLENKIRKGSEHTNDLITGFRKEWKKHFRRTLNTAAARSYVTHMREKLIKNKVRHGGAYADPLVGAPLDLTTRPGVYGQYGNFLDYVNKGFWNPEPGIKAECGSMDFTPILPKDMGSNQAGGKRKGRGKTRKQRGGTASITGAPYAAEFRPFVAENPQTFQASIQNTIKGLPGMISSDPTVSAYNYKAPQHLGTIPGIDVAGLDRNLLKDITVPY